MEGSNTTTDNTYTTTSTGEEDVEETQENYIKIGIIVLKIIYVCTMMVFAIFAYKKRNGGYTKETCVFLFFIIEMMSLLVFDLFAKYIVLLYFMLLSSNYVSFYVFNFLISSNHLKHGSEVKRKFAPFALVLNICFVLAIIACFLPSIGVKCTDAQQYPHTFFFVIICHLFFSALVQVFYWSSHFIGHDDSLLDKDTKDAREAAVFKKQIKIFVVYNSILCAVQTILVVTGYMMIEKGADI